VAIYYPLLIDEIVDEIVAKSFVLALEPSRTISQRFRTI